MFYRCKSCGGNVTYNPDKKKMICESCGNEGEPELISQDKKHVCNNCGAEIEADQIGFIAEVSILWYLCDF